MIDIVGKDCTGCGACIAGCPKQCIIFVNGNDGFQYPSINYQICIGCELCTAVCPEINDIVPNLFEQKSFAAQSKNIPTRAASGGAFYSLARTVILTGGIVFGAAYVNGNEIRHIGVESVEDLPQLFGSKYVQSLISSKIFRQIERELKGGRYVLFSGTPCQVEGLRLFLRKSYNNLILIDLICHGVPSAQIFKDYIEFCENLRGRKVREFRFRDNRDGWNNIFKSTIIYEDGTEEYNSALSNLWNRIFFSELITRPSCNDCKFTNFNRCGDLTLGDFWGIDNISKVSSHKGVSLLLCNSQKGWDLLQSSGLYLFEANTNEREHPNLFHPTAKHSQASEFEEYYSKYGFEKAIKKYFNFSRWLDFKICTYKFLMKIFKQ